MDRCQIARQVFSEFAPLFEKLWGYHSLVEEKDDNEIRWRGFYLVDWLPWHYGDLPEFHKGRVVCRVTFSDLNWTVIQVWGRNYWTRAKRKLEVAIRRLMAQGFLAMVLDEIERHARAKGRKGNTLFFPLRPDSPAYLPVTFKFSSRKGEITVIVPTMTDKRIFKYPIQREARLVKKIVRDVFSVIKELSAKIKALEEL